LAIILKGNNDVGGVMKKTTVRKLRFFSSIRTKFALAYFAVVAIVLLMMNTYFLVETRDMIYSFKRPFVQTQATHIRNSIEEMLHSISAHSLSAESDEDVEVIYLLVSVLEIAAGTQIVVVDIDGGIIYDPNDRSLRDDFPISHINRAMSGVSGYDISRSEFYDGAFLSSAFAPITSHGTVIGVVYVHDEDTYQGAMLLEMQSTILNISIIVGIFSIVAVSLILWSVMRRVSSIISAIESVREGEYSYLISMRGNDELAVLGDEFNSLTSRLRETEEVRRRFVADASHELKTPLASIRLLSDSILQNKNVDIETVHEFIEDIGLEAVRLAKTTDKLMTLTRLDSQVVDELSTIDVKEAVIVAMRMLKPLAESMDVTLTSTLNDDCYILGTEESVHQIIFNLIENAVKYNKPNGSVEVRLEVVNKTVLLSVRDRGVGVPDEDMPYIFDRFYRVDKSRSRDAGGSGLGLSIVDDTVRGLKGKITVARRMQGGMNFTVMFDLLEEK